MNIIYKLSFIFTFHIIKLKLLYCTGVKLTRLLLTGKKSHINRFL